MNRDSLSTRRSTSHRILVLAAAICGLLCTGAPNARAQGDAVTATLSAAQASFSSADRVVIQLTLANSGDSAAGLLRWLTPEDGVRAPIFVVERDGVRVAYTGRIAKRAAPTESDYVFLAAGESVTWDVDLTDAYDFSATGTYAILYDVASPALFVGAQPDSALTSNPLEVFVEGRARPAMVRATAKIESGSSSYVSCSASRIADITAARDAATTYAADASAYLQAGVVDTHFTTWFGAYDATRYATVKTHFTNILSRIGANPMTFDCSESACSPGIYAFVFPSDTTYTVYLCSEFWATATTGTDSKAGTLIHETSHFTAVAGTSDFAYGQNAAKSLAISNPAQAIMNADSHEYFGESSLPLATPTPAATASPTPGPTGAASPTPTPAATAAATPTPTFSGSGFVPPDKDAATCELGVAKQLSKLSACATKCQVKQADSAVKNTPFDDDACEDGTGKPTSCRAGFDAASAKLLGKGACPACLDATAQSAVATQAMQFVEAYNGAIYCAGTTPLGGDDTGFVPPDADTGKCESGVANALKKLAACLAKCDAKQADALAKGKTFDASACKAGTGKPTSCRAAFDASSVKLLGGGACPACLDATAQGNAADAVTSLVAAQKPALFCAGTTPLP